MGRADYFSSFKHNADEFICSTLPGFSHAQVQYSPGTIILVFVLPLFPPLILSKVIIA
jgi:hypothetical protein